MFFANIAFPAWRVDTSQILSGSELARVLAAGSRRSDIASVSVPNSNPH